MIEKISQTWLASHSGPIDAAIASRSTLASPAVRSAARRSQVEDAGAEVSAGEDGVDGQRCAEDDRQQRGKAHVARRRGAGEPGHRPLGDPAHRPHRERRQPDVEQREGGEGGAEPGSGGDPAGGAKHAVDDPRLPAQLADQPAELVGQERGRTGGGDRHHRRSILGSGAAPPAAQPVPEPERDQRRCRSRPCR